jgi:beta-barrel assembly-enhancing protease
MNLKTLRDISILALFFGGIWASIAYLPFSFNSPEIDFPIEKEQLLGDYLVKDLYIANEKVEIFSNPVLDSAIHVIVKRLSDHIELSEYDYKILVVKDDEVNAFALPGGYMIINSGLIQFADHPEEVAAVLAHEIGHVEKRHVVNKLMKELGIYILFAVLTGGDNILSAEVGRIATSTVFDRGQEKEADEFALELMEKASINPKVIAIFFRKLNEKYGAYNENLELLMTHPHNKSRIKNALEYKTGEHFTSKPIDLEWDRVKKSIE